MPKATVFSLALFSLSFACGREDGPKSDANATLIAADESSTLTTQCEAVPVPKIEILSYCKTLSNGSVSKIDLRPSTYVQDPQTCEVASPNDGVRATIVEMGFSPC